MKHSLILFLIIFAVVILTNCKLNQNNDSKIEPCQSQNNSNRDNINKNIISKETAVLIAKGATLSDYDFKYYDEIVLDKGDNWMVTFDFKPEYRNRNGGAPTVVIGKSNGNIVSLGGTK